MGHSNEEASKRFLNVSISSSSSFLASFPICTLTNPPLSTGIRQEIPAGASVSVGDFGLGTGSCLVFGMHQPWITELMGVEHVSEQVYATTHMCDALNTSLLQSQVLIAHNRIQAALKSPNAATFVKDENIRLYAHDFMDWTDIPRSLCDVKVIYSHWAAFPTYSKMWMCGQLLVSGVNFAMLSCPGDTQEGSGADCVWCINTLVQLPVATTRAEWTKHPDRLVLLGAGSGLQTAMVVARIVQFNLETPAVVSDGAPEPVWSSDSGDVRTAFPRAAKDKPTARLADFEHLQDVGKATKNGNSVFNHTVLTQTLQILGIAKPEAGDRSATVTQSLEYLWKYCPNLFLEVQPDDCLGMSAVETEHLFEFEAIHQRTMEYYAPFGGKSARPHRGEASFRMAEWMVCFDIARHLATISGASSNRWLRGLDHFGKLNHGLHQVLADQIKLSQGQQPGARAYRWCRRQEALRGSSRSSRRSSSDGTDPTPNAASTPLSATTKETPHLVRSCLFFGLVQITPAELAKLWNK
jgi:hypothetical protein